MTKIARPDAAVAILVRLPQDLRDELAARATVEDRSVASLMRLAARQYLARTGAQNAVR